MSYCRFSSMNWMCDVYVYESCYGGWTIHVAKNRRIIAPIPEVSILRVPRFGMSYDADTGKTNYPSAAHSFAGKLFGKLWMFWHNRIHLASLRVIPSRKIGLSHDGKSFSDDSAGECADRLEWLRSEGYKVPQYAIDALREEQKEVDEQP